MIFGTPLDSHLDPGERLVWNGQPKQGIRLQASDWIAIPFSLLWCSFALFWEALALGLYQPKSGQTHPGSFMALFGLPFVLIGIYMVVGRFFGDALTRRKTWYGVTDKRVIILSSFLGTRLSSIDLANLTNLNLIERKDNSGDVQFGFIADLGMYNSRRRPLIPGFYQIPDARRVYNLIREVQQKARQ
jgi:hypothetical protein